MNIILFTQSELQQPLPHTDRRNRHIRKVLKSKPGDILNVGLVNGNRGIAQIVNITATKSIELSFTLDQPTIPLCPVRLVCGLPRPQQAKRILRDCASMGVSHLWFALTEQSEKSYLHSSLWKNNGWEHCIYEGVEQAGATMIPDVKLYKSLNECVKNLPVTAHRFVLDTDIRNSNVKNPLLKPALTPTEITLFIGSEKGWSPDERQRLLSEHCVPVYLGNRILRTDTACIAAVTMALASFTDSEFSNQ